MNGNMQMNDILATAPIQSLEALRTLVDSQRHRIVTLLAEEALTAKELAERLGIGRTRLYYHLDMLEKHGLVQVVDSRVVSGIIERRYRAVSRTFRVDRNLLAANASEDQIAGTQAAIIDSVAADLHMRAAAQLSSSEEDLLVARMFLRLNERRRRELRARLSALIEEYRDADADGVETEFALAVFTTKGSEE